MLVSGIDYQYNPLMQKLTDEQKEIYEWQIPIADFGLAGQEKLNNATALISRCGGLGGPVALNLAAAGIGKLIIAHAGDVKPSDLNRQILTTCDWIGKPRIESIIRRLKAFNPQMEIQGVSENITEQNVADLVGRADSVFDCAPLFEERYLMNQQCVRQNKPMIEAAIYEMQGQIMTIVPGKSACLKCLYPETPSQWTRRFPVLGAVSALAGAVAALEGIKLIAGFGETLTGALLYFDTRSMQFKRFALAKKVDCSVCGANK